MIGIPYATIVVERSKYYAKCPECGELFLCSQGKDQETVEAKGYPAHYRTAHGVDKTFGTLKKQTAKHMKTYILVGDICHPGRIAVQAETPEEAVELAAAGEFVVEDEDSKNLEFKWNHDEVEEES